MKYYRMTAELLSPLMIQQNRQSNARQSIGYLPGSTLRGALAAQFLRMGGSPEDEDFRALFLDGPVCFPDLFPANDKNTVSTVLPLTSISCKRKPGFVMQDGHGVRDILARTAMSRTEKRPADQDFWECPECCEDMKPFPGFWNGNTALPCKSETTMLYHRHTGIDRDTGAIAPDIFFINQTIADFRKDRKSEDYHQQYLSGAVFIREEQFQILSSLIEDSLFVGADRTRGLGELKLSINEIPSPGFDIEEWNHGFKERLSSIMEKPLPKGICFSVKLESHAILVDKFLRPVSEIEEFSSSDFNPILKITKPQTIRGWQSAWGLAKPDDEGVSMGSVYLFEYTGDDMESLKNLLDKLVISGIGLRREEGFGRISICDPLHIIEEVI